MYACSHNSLLISCFSVEIHLHIKSNYLDLVKARSIEHKYYKNVCKWHNFCLVFLGSCLIFTLSHPHPLPVPPTPTPPVCLNTALSLVSGFLNLSSHYHLFLFFGKTVFWLLVYDLRINFISYSCTSKQIMVVINAHKLKAMNQK